MEVGNNTNINAARQAAHIAIRALNGGDKVKARHWAQKAVQLAPEMEESWLVLAAVAEPHASKAYLEQALKINLTSQRARQGLLWVQKQLAAAPGSEDTQQIMVQPHPSAPDPGNSLPSSLPVRAASKRVGIVFIAAILGVALALTSSLIAGATLLGNVRSVKAAAVYGSPGYNEASSGTANNRAAPLTAAPVRLAGDAPNPTLSPQPIVVATRVLPPFPTAAPTHVPTLPPAKPTGPKRMEVVISKQRLYAYQGDQLVYQFVVSTGANNNTPTGTFKILDKVPDAYSYSLGFWMPDWMGFYWIGDLEDGIHALPVLSDGEEIWGNGLGTPITTGCVVLSAKDAQQLYKWVDEDMQLQIRE